MLSHGAVAQRLKAHVKAVASACPSLQDKSVDPHVLRHACPMSLLHADVGTHIIALWLRHAGVRSTDATSTRT